MKSMNETTNHDLSAFGKASATIQETPLNADELRLMDAYWRTTLYLSVGMIYLRNNPLLLEPLRDARASQNALAGP
jgi:xylulose-5-phosphate/fructose-6-phosphate phosphoketolase